MPKSKAAKPEHDDRLGAMFIAKAALTLVGVAVIQLALCGAYLGAFHSLQAKDIPISVIGAQQVVEPLAKTIEQNSNGAYKVSVVASWDEALQQIKEQRSYGAYMPGSARAGQDSTVIVASAASQALAKSIPESLAPVSTSLHTKQNVTDVAELPSGDNRGLGIFYTAFAWVFGGYLAAAALGIIRGERAFTKRNALLRIGGLLVFSAATSLAVAAIAVYGFEVFTDGYWQLVGIGTLATFATSLAASVVIALVGTLGTALVILFFVILGNPASGGTVAMPLIGDGPWQWFNHLLPTGIGVDAIRSSLYFGNTNIGTPILALVIYLVVGAALLLLVGHFRGSVSFYASEIAREENEKNQTRKTPKTN